MAFPLSVSFDSLKSHQHFRITAKLVSILATHSINCVSYSIQGQHDIAVDGIDRNSPRVLGSESTVFARPSIPIEHGPVDYVKGARYTVRKNVTAAPLT